MLPKESILMTKSLSWLKLNLEQMKKKLSIEGKRIEYKTIEDEVTKMKEIFTND